ncbi:MAG: mevalonate kinase [Methanosarcinales archaeon]|nr:mevalonate kinase [Methanosarcinales archaeon]
MTITTCSAPGKIYFFGEHAVVYQKKAIACAVDLRTQVSVQEANDYVISSSIGTTGLDTNNHPYVTRCIKEMEEYIPEGVNIKINSDLPVGSGLGSSGAVTVATMYALNIHFEMGFSLEEIATLGHTIELKVQGAASPTDTFVSTMGGAVVVPDKRKLSLPECAIVIGNTGKFSSTKDLVVNVRNLKETYSETIKPVIETIGRLSSYGETLIASKDYQALGRLMNINHALLDALEVGSEELSKLVWASRKAGAWGAKTTGAGGGGCIVAITDRPDEVANAIEVEGYQAIITRTTSQGVREE